jgi:hypothetical protein
MHKILVWNLLGKENIGSLDEMELVTAIAEYYECMPWVLRLRLIDDKWSKTSGQSEDSDRIEVPLNK